MKAKYTLNDAVSLYHINEQKEGEESAALLKKRMDESKEMVRGFFSELGIDIEGETGISIFANPILQEEEYYCPAGAIFSYSGKTVTLYVEKSRSETYRVHACIPQCKNCEGPRCSVNFWIYTANPSDGLIELGRLLETIGDLARKHQPICGNGDY